MDTLLIVDSHALIHRAYHAIPPLSTRSGIPTNALYGYINLIQKAIQDIKPTHLVTCFDTPTESFRKKILTDYQATRKPTEDNLKVQFNIVKELVDAAHIKRFEADYYEADDVIGTIVKILSNQHLRIILLTGDKDMFQLVSDYVYVLTPQIGFSKSLLYGPKEVKDKLGITPDKVADYKALSGDPSDNYEGLRNIGPKTAVKLISQYGSIENMAGHFDEKTMSVLHTMKQVATIVCDVPNIFVKLSDLEFDKLGGDDFKLALQKYELYSLLARFFPTDKNKNEVAKSKIKLTLPPNQEGLF